MISSKQNGNFFLPNKPKKTLEPKTQNIRPFGVKHSSLFRQTFGYAKRFIQMGGEIHSDRKGLSFGSEWSFIRMKLKDGVSVCSFAVVFDDVMTEKWGVFKVCSLMLLN